MAHPLRVKICGVTSAGDAAAAVRAGADLVGLNFYPPSPRFVRPETAAVVLAELPASVEPVAVCVEEPCPAVAERLRTLPRLTTLQWHGADPPAADEWEGSLIVAWPVRGPESLAAIERYLERCRARGRLPAALLLDAHVSGLYGGTGRTAPWDLLAEFRPGVPLFLAGGLTPENVAEAVRRVRPDGVDVAGGVEAVPGRKDPEKVRRFVEAAREAAARL
jgi:phosphoribosylanthranilate isomerase